MASWNNFCPGSVPDPIFLKIAGLAMRNYTQLRNCHLVSNRLKSEVHFFMPALPL